LLKGKHTKATPLILVGRMWADFVDWARGHMLAFQPPLASPEDLAIPVCVDTADDAIRVLREHHQKWRAGGANAGSSSSSA
jgi:hypothetical protein